MCVHGWMYVCVLNELYIYIYVYISVCVYGWVYVCAFVCACVM